MENKSNKEIRLHTRFIKEYKKNTLAIFFSFALTFMLLTILLVLMHTNHRIDNMQDKTLLTPSDCYLYGLSKAQIEQLKKDSSIRHLAVAEEEYLSYERNHQTLFIEEGDDAMITMMAIVLEGKLPEKDGEIAAEKWVLLNLGIEPVIGRTFDIQDPETGKTKECKLTGILSDMSANKKYGTIYLYSALEFKEDGQYVAYLKLKEGVSYEEKMNSLLTELGIQKKQIKKCPAKEDFRELYWTDVKVVFIILFICMVVFYGIFRIASIARVNQYGILRALGMKKKQLQKMILQELYQIYWVSVPAGMTAGLMIAYFIMGLSGDRDMEIYFYNERARFDLIIPVWPLLICVILTALLVGIVGYAVGKKVVRAPIVEIISGHSLTGKKSGGFFGIDKSNSKMNTLFQMAGKYIFKDVKTSCFVVLTIGLGATLFTGLAYKAQTLKIFREDTKEMWYLNGEYAMTMQSFNNVKQGISRESAKEIENIRDITSIKTASGLPIRVIDEDGIKKNEAYYEELNTNLKEYYGYGNAGNDGVHQVYKSILYGYNTNALKELKKYVISGDFNPDGIKEDEIILSVLSMDDTKENKFPGHYKEGTPLMDYKAGDEIQIKYRKDLQTDSLAYENFTDSDAEYVYKTYKIAAIVSFEYMFDCNRTVYPLLITSDQWIQKITPESGFQSMYADGKGEMDLSRQMALEQQLIRICSQNNHVSTRSLISDIKQNEMFYRKQMIYVYGIAIVAFLLVFINIINNLRYRMQTRTKEICMLRAIGMSVSMAKRMLLIENMLLGLTAVAAAFILSQPTLRYLYRISDMRAFGRPFRFNYVAFSGASAAALLICMLLSFRILKSWKTKRIVEGIGKIE